jgi:hypothetical protein
VRIAWDSGRNLFGRKPVSERPKLSKPPLLRTGSTPCFGSSEKRVGKQSGAGLAAAGKGDVAIGAGIP